MHVPKASERGTLRRGFFTSPAVNVMLFQPSAENSEPTWAMHRATNKPNVVAGVIPGATGVYPCGRHRLVKSGLPMRLHPTAPTTITPSKAMCLADVNAF